MAGDAGAAGGAGGAGGRAGSGAGAGAGPGGAPAGAGGAGAPARWNYCVTANRPTRATHSCCGAFTAPGARNLLVAKSSFVEIFLLTPRGLKALHDVPIYGRIAVMELFRAKVRDCCLPPQSPPPPQPPLARLQPALAARLPSLVVFRHLSSACRPGCQGRRLTRFPLPLRRRATSRTCCSSVPSSARYACWPTTQRRESS